MASTTETNMIDAAEASAEHAKATQTDAPAVSIIIPAYNAARYIGETLDSVFAQTYNDYEIVVVNDGSPDTPELERALAPYRERIVYLTQENRGPGGARNTALRAARGRFVALLDADDLWEPGYLAAQVAALEADPSADVVYANGVIFGGGADSGRELMEAFPTRGEVTFEKVLKCECTVLICAVVRREAVERVGGFDETMRGTEDFDLWLRILHAGGRIIYRRERLMRYRRAPGSLSSSEVRMHGQALAVFEKIARVPDLGEGERRALDEVTALFRAKLRLAEGKQALARGDVTEARAALAEANAFFKSAKIGATLLLLRLAPGLVRGLYRARERRTSGVRAGA